MYPALKRAAKMNGNGKSTQLTLVADQFVLPGYRNLKEETSYFPSSRPTEETRPAPQS